MDRHPDIQVISRKDIDTRKWDGCIDMAPNGRVYAYSFYLDIMSEHWSGLLLGDYEAVMPLTWNKKYGIYYLYQPFLCAQLGVFGKIVTPEIVDDFLRAIPSRFRYIDIYLNASNTSDNIFDGYYLRVNYLLSLEKDYKDIYDNYRENIKRNIRKAEQLGCQIKKDLPPNDVIEIAREQIGTIAKTRSGDFENTKKLYEYLHRPKQAITYGVFSASGKLLASAIFFFSHQRAYYILVGNHPDGRTIGASHALIDAFIKDHAGQNLVLDFEGSDIRNLAFFYSSFGAVEEKYPALRINRLPFYLKWLKK